MKNAKNLLRMFGIIPILTLNVSIVLLIMLLAFISMPIWGLAVAVPVISGIGLALLVSLGYLLQIMIEFPIAYFTGKPVYSVYGMRNANRTLFNLVARAVRSINRFVFEELSGIYTEDILDSAFEFASFLNKKIGATQTWKVFFAAVVKIIRGEYRNSTV